MTTKVPRAGQDKTPPADRIKISYKNLLSSSAELKSATEELSKVVTTIEKPLNSIKPHVATWYKLAGNEDPIYGDFWHRDIGYAKVGDVWGITLREIQGNLGNPDLETSEIWLFKDAPQWMQIESIGKLPDLLEEIVNRTQETTKKLKAKTEEARVLAEALSKAVADDSNESLL